MNDTQKCGITTPMNDNTIDMEMNNSSSPPNEHIATDDRTDTAMNEINNESDSTSPDEKDQEEQPQEIRNLQQQQLDSEQEIGERNRNGSDQSANNDQLDQNNSNNDSPSTTTNDPLPTRVHRTVSTEEFKNIVKQFQVKLPPLSYLPDWVDEYTPIKNAMDKCGNNDDDGSDIGGGDSYSDDSYDSDDSEIASNTSFLEADDSSHEQKERFRNVQSKPYNNHEKAACGDDDGNDDIVNLPTLPNDIASQILAFVPYLKDILNYSKTCKSCYENGYNNDLVWNIKFHQRWNAKLDGGMVDSMHTVYEDVFDDIVRNKNHMEHQKSTSSTARIAMMKKELFWRRCYYNAFHNVHDLWVSHWNCVMPVDAVSPGRTVIPDIRLQKRSKPYTSQSSSTSSEGTYPTRHNQNCTHSKCPTCRYHPFLNHHGLQELNYAMDQELKYINQFKKNDESKSDEPNDPKSFVADPVDDAETTLAMYSILLQRKLNGRSVEDILNLENKNDSRVGNGDGNNSSQNVQTFLDNLISKCRLKVTPAGAVYQSSQYSLAKWCRRMRVVHNLDLSKRINDQYFTELEDEEINSNDSSDIDNDVLKSKEDLESISATEYHIQQKRQVSLHAFERSATLRRKIDINQYRSSGLNFLTDALFFPIEPSHKRIRQLESVVNDEIDKHGDPSQVHWSYKMTDIEHTILDIYGSKIACTEEANSTTSVNDLPTAQPLAPLTDLKNVPAHDLSTLASLGACHETAQHTWHVIRLSNPDFALPITFRVYTQRKDCFAAYPAEGYLLPGETCHVTLGIRALGSLLAHAFDDTDTKREEAHMFISDVLDEESILPRCGYCVRYFYAPTIPCVPSDHRFFKDPVWLQPNTTLQVEWIPQQNSPSKYSGMIERLWNNVKSEDNVRTIYISTHINGSYAFDEFQNRTLSPFEVKASHDGEAKPNIRFSTYPLTLISPNIQERDPELFNLLHDLDQELVSSHEATNYRTEKGCVCCGRDWGARSEYLGRIYVLRKAVCDEFARQRSRQMHRLLDCLESIPSLFRHVLPQEGISKVIDVDNNLINKIHQMCFCLHAVLLNKKGDELQSPRQRKTLRSYEIFENIVTEEVLRLLLNILFEKEKDQNTNDEGSMFWRHGGIYNTPRSSNRSGESDPPSKYLRRSVQNTAGGIIIKKEPAHMKNITELNHQPGIIPVGKQDDPNYLDNEDCQYFSDIFKDKAILGFTAAMAMIQDPSALIGQGIFHKLPGSIPRCHRIEIGSFLPTSHRSIENACIKSLKKIKSLNITNGDLLNKESHVDNALTIFSINDEDFDSIRLISDSKKETYLFSFRNFSKNIPPPGINTRIISSGRIGQSWLPEKLITMYSSLQRHRSRNNNSRRRTRRARPMLGNFGGLRFFNAMWYLSSQVGLSVDDESKPGEILLDRRIMIASQWMSNSLMFLPLLWTLFARWAMIISPLPLDYYLDGLVRTFFVFLHSQTLYKLDSISLLSHMISRKK